MSLLEEKLKRIRDILDAAEPPAGHLARFESRLDELHEAAPVRKAWYRTRGFRVAAVAAVLLGVSLALYLAGPSGNGGRVLSNTLPVDIQKAKLYYESEARQNLHRIDQCASTPEEAAKIRQMAEEQFMKIEANSSELETVLAREKDNKKVQDALIVNYKTKADLVEGILRTLCKI